jgi:phenylpropionate dioxygenase-like ring-hydroxylating dioxygenase large terminal subunit
MCARAQIIEDIVIDHATQVKVLKELFRQLDNDVNVDAGRQLRNLVSAYTCKDLAAKEWQTFFRSHPQLIGLSGDLPGPGTFMTVDNFGVSVLATRSEDGEFRAFVNACRHCGVRVANATRGESKRFQCPFHHWTYSNSGELLRIPRQKDFGDVDRSCHGLKQIPAVEKYGQLWVHPQADGHLNVDELLGDLAPELAGWNVGDLVCMGETVIDKRLNWKLANDTFGETYHFSRLHQNTLGQLFHSDALAYETFGRNHRFVFPTKTIGYLRDKPEQEWGVGRVAKVLYYLFPNIQFNVGPRSVSLIKMYPDADNPGRSITHVSHYFSRYDLETTQDNDRTLITADHVYDSASREGKVALSIEASMEVFDSTIEQEDYAMGETTQQSAESGALEDVLFDRNEPALHHYHNTFRAALNLPPLDEVA